MSSPSCSVIVVSYNSARELRSWRTDLATAGVEVIVVDNNSTDDSVALAETLGAHVVALAENTGWSKACNVGAEVATGEVLLFVNPDVTLAPDDASKLATVAVDTGGPVVPRFLNVDGSPQNFYHRLPTAAMGLFLYLNAGQRLDRLAGNRVLHHARYNDRPELHTRVDHGGGACTAIPRSLFEQLGGYDESMWLFFSDTDLSRRAAEAGHPLVVAWDIRVTHEGGTSIQREHWQDIQILFQRDYVAYARAAYSRVGRWTTVAGVGLLTGALPALAGLVRGQPGAVVAARERVGSVLDRHARGS